MDIKYWSEFEISIMREEQDYGIVYYEKAIWKTSLLRHWSVIEVNSHYANVYLTTEYITQSQLGKPFLQIWCLPVRHYSIVGG